jgi:hypothetical protein
MKYRFPLSDVQIEISLNKKQVENPIYEDEEYKLNQNAFSMDVENVGYFFAENGNRIEILPYPGVDKDNLELYLNGSTYGAILHQRQILTMHGSCFVFEGKGIMICGESGAGKSSLTTSFVMDGNEFLTDDVTPILFQNKVPHIWAMSDRVKLWDDSLKQLNQSSDGLSQIDPEVQKFFFPLQSSQLDFHALDHILLLETTENKDLVFEEITGAEKLTALRKEIYRPEYILGMPENESIFFSQLAVISQQVRVTRLSRPIQSPILNTKEKLKAFFQGSN